MTEQKVINFMGIGKLAALVSIVLVVIAIASLVIKGLNFGLDFTGGTQVEVGYEQAPDLNEVRATLEQAGYNNAVVVNFGSDRDVLVRLQTEGVEEQDKVGAQLVAALREAAVGEVDLRRIEFVGPQVGEELREQGGLALLIALLGVMLYVAVRFQFKFSVGAVVALIHDVTIILGLFAFFQWDFDLTVLAALLAVIGYSLNDTIVVSDRIRENFRKIRKSSAIEVINISLTQTVARTIVTSVTTLLVLLALFFAGGEMIHSFSEALIIGVLVGTYSSIYVAANVLLLMKIDQQDLIIPPKEGVDFDDGMP
ncbi:MAG: protein translocase subunit SecF [Pseudomonadales bacterium]